MWCAHIVEHGVGVVWAGEKEVFGFGVDDGTNGDVEAASRRRKGLAVDGVEEDAAVVERKSGIPALLDHV